MIHDKIDPDFVMNMVEHDAWDTSIIDAKLVLLNDPLNYRLVGYLQILHNCLNKYLKNIGKLFHHLI